MTPDPSPAAVFDRASATYDAVGVDFFTVFGERLVAEAGLQPQDRVLDIGTGRGAVLIPAARAVGAEGEVVGIDLAPGMVERTTADLQSLDLGQAAVRLADAANPPEDLGAFDAVLSSLVLFFLDDPAEGLTRWAAHIRPGGRLGLATFLPDDDDDALRDVFTEFIPSSTDGPPAPDGPTPFELVKDAGWLDDAVQAAGLDTVRVTTLRHATRFADIEQWWRWAMSQGMRVALEAVPEADHEAFRAAAAQALTPAEDGGLQLHVTVRFTVAQKPGG